MTLTMASVALVYLCALQPSSVYHLAVLYDVLCVLSGQKHSYACEQCQQLPSAVSRQHVLFATCQAACATRQHCIDSKKQKDISLRLKQAPTSSSHLSFGTVDWQMTSFCFLASMQSVKKHLLGALQK